MSKRCYVRVVALVAGLAFGVTGCTIDSASPEKEQAASTTVEKKPAPVVSVSDGASKVNPADPVVVKSLGEGLSDVTMTNENGKVVEGEMAADARSWRTAEPLGYSRSYTVVATDRNGEKTTTELN
ncbi:transpeptidase [Corynebacterium diphtheriae]|nr:transpeptidase [Corynebacterium diphtheriae]CAB1021764.1 transpeptidase [Corynebacterium diphtheriae]